MENYQDMEIIQDMEAQHHTLLHRILISRIIYIYRQVYNIYAYELH